MGNNVININRLSADELLGVEEDAISLRIQGFRDETEEDEVIYVYNRENQTSNENGYYILPKLEGSDTFKFAQTKNRLLIRDENDYESEFELIRLDYRKVCKNDDGSWNRIDIEDKNNSTDNNVGNGNIRTQIKLTYETKNNFKITNVLFKSGDMEVDNEITWEWSYQDVNNDSGNHIYQVTFYAKPVKYINTYYISDFEYINTEGTTIKNAVYNEYNIGTPYYIELSSEDDWNRKIQSYNPEINPDINEYSLENYIIKNSFELNAESEDLKLNAVIGNLDGIETEETGLPIISLAEEEQIITSNLIYKVGNISNVYFDQFNIENAVLINEASGIIKECVFEDMSITVNNNSISENVGIIATSTGTISGVSIHDINIEAEEQRYVGALSGYHRGHIQNGITMTNIKVKGKRYTGGLCGLLTGNLQCTSLGMINVSVEGTDNYIGGIVGYCYQNISVESEGVYIGEETGISVKGVDYVGGFVGRSLQNIIVSATGGPIEVEGRRYVGGISGSGTSISPGENTEDLLNFSNIKVKGTSNVGGIIGRIEENGICNNVNASVIEMEIQSGDGIRAESVGGIVGYVEDDETNIQNVSVENISINNNVWSTTSNIGGIVGNLTGICSYSSATSINIYNGRTSASFLNVGICVGYTSNRIDGLESTESSVRNIYDSNNIGGIVGKSEYNEENQNAIANCKTSRLLIENNTGNNIGGISGINKGTIYKVSVTNSSITGGSNVGGITGEFEGGDLTYGKYYLIESFCSSSTINANTNSGGLVGQLDFGDIQYCYSANNIITSSSNSGGIVGCVNNENMNTSINEKVVKIRYNFVANTINNDDFYISSSNAGGIVGFAYKSIDEESFTNNLVVSNVTGTNASVGIGMIEEDSSNIEALNNHVCIYEHIKINGVEVPRSDRAVSINGLKNNDTINIRNILEDAKFEYDSNGTYYPHIKDLEDPEIEIGEEASATFTLRNNTLKSVLSQTNNIYEVEELPSVYTYAIDINKINIEFSEINPNVYFEVISDNNTILNTQPIKERVYTFEYDFDTEFSIKVWSTGKWYEENFKPEDLRKVLDIQNDEYIYLTNNTLYSNKRDIEGEYLNLYKGKALSKDKEIYDLTTMELFEKQNDKLNLLEEQSSISEVQYNNTTIETFYHCSKVIDNEGNYTYQDKQIFIKDGTMFMIDGEIQSKGDSIIIDSYNEKQYETILGTDNKLYDLLSEIKYPSDFKNKNIRSMTNNLDNNNNIVLVYYENGEVYGFNYITGEKVYQNNVEQEKMSFTMFVQNKLKSDKELYNMNIQNYEEAQKLTDKLEKTSVEQAIDILDINEEQNDIDIKENHNVNKSVVKYAAVYDTRKNEYVVYSTEDLLDVEMKSENEKINEKEELVTYYANLSTSKINLKQVGIILFQIVIGTICVILIIMYKKSRRKT